MGAPFIKHNVYILLNFIVFMAAQKLESEVKSIKKDLEYIKKHMVDIDCIMTEEDYAALLEYRREKKAGKLISHRQLKEELGSDA